MNKINLKIIVNKFLLSLLIISIFIPVITFSATELEAPLDYSGWVQCDGVVDKNNPAEANRNVQCNFQNLMKMVNYLINWAFIMCIPVLIGLLANSGYLYMTGTEGNIKKAKTVMTNAVIGFIIALMAWFIVVTLLKWLKNPQFTGTDTLIQQSK